MNHEERYVIAALSDMCVELKIRTLIQVGAEDGYESAFIQKETGCRTIAIEGNTACSPCSPDIEYHHAIIGATDGLTTFYIHQNTGLSGHFPRNDNLETKIVTPQTRLDTFCAHRRIKPDGLVIDTEGSTLEVLEGSGILLADIRLVYAEVQSDEIRPGIRLFSEVDSFLAPFCLSQYDQSPTYGKGGAQFNQTWINNSL